ncbi:MAG: hypothetical protein AAB845_01060 [Patescibacteria group bacterium]
MSAKNTETETKNKILEKSLSFLEAMPDLSQTRLSGDIFYGVFIGLTLLLSGLIMGTANRVEAVSQTVEVISPSEMRLERDVEKMVDGYPIEAMLPYIVKHDRNTTAFIIGIAKKESNWGKRIPVTANGEDCYNYWGYRGEGSRGTAMGHGCFGSKREAVRVISKRINTLMKEYHRDTAEELVVWKCGYNCDAQSTESVDKWISDVGYYADQVKN